MRLRTLSASALAATALFHTTATAKPFTPRHAEPDLRERTAAPITITTYTIYRTVQRVVATATSSASTPPPPPPPPPRRHPTTTTTSASLLPSAVAVSSGRNDSVPTSTTGSSSSSSSAAVASLTLSPYVNGTVSALTLTPTGLSTASGGGYSTASAKASATLEGAAAAGKVDWHGGVLGLVVVGMGLRGQVWSVLLSL
ncbi:hypothetical protein EJ03DRAFT_378764 [Teratosphaeria nubilosa]|uniref:REJ domain-containing protein n=1 Tax=Teratosphaeria nubilosa TaxID=161662 RepID=A0A6G1KW07_9PEZI|nr:hypothetical protein EJ03DRAFT_378764 [Teratosphaeria nubilosa]